MIVFRPNVHAYMPGADIVNRPVVAAASGSWADYANSVLDSLLAVDFRGAASLAAATLYGTAPTVDTEPGGGISLTADGLVCANDTALATGIDFSSDSGVIYAYIYVPNTASNGFVAGSIWNDDITFQPSNGTNVVARYGTKNWSVGTAVSGWQSLGFVSSGRFYLQGVNTNEITSTVSTSTDMIIGGYNDGGTGTNLFAGTIAAIAIGTLKAGADADTVASELHTRMQTAA